jgi:hypothetical protein
MSSRLEGTVRRTYRIGNPADKIREHKWALGEHVTSAHAVDCNWHTICNVKQDHGSGDNGVESTESMLAMVL